MSSDEQAIRQLVDDWMRYTLNGEVDALMDLMTDDMVFLTVRNSPMSKAEFEKGMRSMEPGRIESKSDIQEIRVEGNVAWCWNNLTIRFTPKDGDEPKVIKGTALGVYLKGVDGKWRLHRDANLIV